MPVALGDDFTLPDDVVTRTLGFLAIKGAGKTYAAGKLVEELIRLGRQVIVIDTVGNWYGLRLAADGKKVGLPIPVFGGFHGDVALESTQGARLAQLLIDRTLSAVVDVSTWRKAERKRFVADFAETLFRGAQESPKPRFLVLEEAQKLAPQQAKGDERMLGAIEDIVRLGRNYGLGVAMLSQRPQSVNKEVLNQVEALFVGQLLGEHERARVAAWVRDQSADPKWVDKLPTLGVGEMMLWSPTWLKIPFRKVRIGKKITYDASATPKFGDVAPAVVKPLTTVDLEALRAALPLLAAAPKSKANGARTSTAKAATSAPSDLAEREREQTLARQELERMRAAVEHETVQLRKRTLEALQKLAEQVQDFAAQIQDLRAAFSKRPVFSIRPLLEPPAKRPARAVARPAPPAAGSESSTLPEGLFRMLCVLARIHPGVMSRRQIAGAAKITSSGGTFGGYWARLVREQLIEQASPGLYRITEQGFAQLGTAAPEPVPNSAEGRIAFWMGRLRPKEQALLECVVAQAAIGVERDELAALIGVEARGGNFAGYLNTLTRNELIEQRGRGGPFYPTRWISGS